MLRLPRLVIVLAFLAVSDAAADDSSALYTGFKADQALLRKTARVGTAEASSPEACQAALRIFRRVSFLFKTRDEVLQLLGDPATLPYGEKTGAAPMSPLVYVFDTGFGGLQYTISFGQFDKVRVSQVRIESRD